MIDLASKEANRRTGVSVDIETRRRKQQDLMIRMVERKVRERAQQLYEQRGQVEGQALADWVQAETEILDSTIHAPLYRRVKASLQILQRDPESRDGKLATNLSHDSAPACDTV